MGSLATKAKASCGGTWKLVGKHGNNINYERSFVKGWLIK